MPWKRMVPEIEVPADLPRWATDPGRTLKPDESEKDLGWDLDEKGPARWMNWLQENTYQWIKKIAGVPFFNWSLVDNSIVNALVSVIYSDTLKKWFATEVATNQVWSSDEGHLWLTYQAPLPAAPVSRGVAIDSARVIIGAGSDVYYSNGGAFVPAGVGGAAFNTLYTAYPTSDRVLVADSAGVVRFATNVAAGLWTPATTSPATALATLIHLEGANWLGMSIQQCYVSTDDGVNFAAAGSVPVGVVLKMVEYNPNSGRLVVVGDDGFNAPAIYTSDDVGATWISRIGGVSDPTGGVLSAVQYIGGSMWFAGGGIITPPTRETMYVSLDDGDTWDLATYHDFNLALPRDIVDVAGDGRSLICVGGNIAPNPFITHSLAVPGPRT